jgi:FMN-dependent NADH-azoreductase
MNILTIKTSTRENDSVSSKIVEEVIHGISKKERNLTIINEDFKNVPFVSKDQTEGIFTEESEKFIQNIEWADVIIIGTPIYNFGVPGVLKAWFDQVARAGRTFNYTENGPVGLLENKKVYLAISSGGVPIGSPMDFASTWLKFVLGFIGISDVELITADQVNVDYEKTMNSVHNQLKELFN